MRNIHSFHRYLHFKRKKYNLRECYSNILNLQTVFWKLFQIWKHYDNHLKLCTLFSLYPYLKMHHPIQSIFEWRPIYKFLTHPLNCKQYFHYNSLNCIFSTYFHETNIYLNTIEILWFQLCIYFKLGKNK